MTNYTLSLRCFRCFESASIVFPHGITTIEGNNGSGKTSVLEAIYLLARAKSFRTPQKSELIRREANDAIARLQFGVKKSIAVKVEKSRAHYKVNRESIHKASQLSQAISVQFIGPHVQTLVTGEPSVRRAFLDWGLFHVEPHYLDARKNYVRVVKQRNAALLSNASDRVLDSLDKSLISYAAALTESRQAYVRELNKQHQETVKALSPVNESTITYRKGWAKDAELSDALATSRQTDRKRNFTSVGPHRDDIQLAINGYNAKKFASSGQQKIAAISMILAQQNFVKNEHKLLLIDDLVSELDIDRCRSLMIYLKERNLDSVITSTGLPDQLLGLVNTLFHVEHGLIESVVE